MDDNAANTTMRDFFRKRRHGDTFTGDSFTGDASGIDLRSRRPGPAAVEVPFEPVRPEPGADRPLRPGPPPLREVRGGVLPAAPAPEEELPRFTLPVANGIRTAASAQAVSGIPPEVSQALREAFTPTRPKQEVNGLFVGRLNTLRRIIAAIEEERAHVVLHGDRGRGKTSLANAVERIAGQAGYLTVKMTCSAELGFEDMFRSLLRRVPANFQRGAANSPFAAGRSSGGFDARLPSGPFSVTQLADVLDGIAGTHVMFVLDEYDRVLSEDVKNKLAELIKNLTDNGSPVTLFVIGVAETVDQLLGKHPSIQRSLVAVHLPPMTDREIERIVLVGAEAAGLTFAPEVRQKIVAFSKGLPYYAQLLSLHAARGAVARGARNVEREDLADALRRCAAEAERSLVEAYHRVIGPEENGTVADVLYLAAQAPFDEFGSFRAADVPAVPLRPGGNGRRLPEASVLSVLTELAQAEGAVLQQVIVPGGHRLRFRNQMMRQFILLAQAQQRGLV